MSATRTAAQIRIANAQRRWEFSACGITIGAELRKRKGERDEALAQVEAYELTLHQSEALALQLTAERDEARACGSSLLAAIREMFTSRGWSEYAVQGVNLSGAVLSCLQSVAANREELAVATSRAEAAEGRVAELESVLASARGFLRWYEVQDGPSWENAELLLQAVKALDASDPPLATAERPITESEDWEALRRPHASAPRTR